MSVSFISSEKLKQFLNMEDSDDVVAEVYKLIDIVLSRYFSSYDADIEELRAVAIHSCWQLAVRGDYNQEMSPLNYLMTRIRNSIHNFLTKKKELAVEELPETPVYDSCFSEAVLEFIKLEIQHLEVYFSDTVELWGKGRMMQSASSQLKHISSGVFAMVRFVAVSSSSISVSKITFSSCLLS